MLGPNVVMPLGLMIPSEGVEARGGPSGFPLATPPTADTVLVCLVGLQRVPSHCASIVTAKLRETAMKGSPTLFKADSNWTGEMELCTEDSLVQPNNIEGKIKLMIHNPSSEAKSLTDLIPVTVDSAQHCADALVHGHTCFRAILR